MKKRIFFKKKKSKYINILFFTAILLLILFSINILDNKDGFFIIEEFTDNFYIIPLYKKGKIIPNLNKQVLHLNLNKDRITLENKFIFKYSIQFYASIYYEKVREKLDLYLQKNIFDKNDIFHVIL